MEQVFVYANSQKVARAEFWATPEFKDYTPVKVEFAGTKHGAKVYSITYRKKKTRVRIPKVKMPIVDDYDEFSDGTAYIELSDGRRGIVQQPLEEDPDEFQSHR